MMRISAARKRAAGEELLLLPDLVIEEMRSLLEQATTADESLGTALSIALLKQAIDTPRRARARFGAWKSSRSGSVEGFLRDSLEAAGSTSSPDDVSGELADLEAQMQPIVDGVLKRGWTWRQAADALSLLLPEVDEFRYESLPLPEGYVSIWGDPY